MSYRKKKILVVLMTTKEAQCNSTYEDTRPQVLCTPWRNTHIHPLLLDLIGFQRRRVPNPDLLVDRANWKSGRDE